jgi:phosphomannomutase
MKNFLDSYIQHLKKDLSLKTKVTLVADAGNGSQGPALTKLVSAELDILLLNGKPDGNFPAHGPDPMQPEAKGTISREVKKSRADFGVLFDADGDRALFFDEEGTYISADEVAFFLSQSFRPPYVLDVRIGQIFRDENVVRSRVGHYFLKRVMKRKRAEFGAEGSGHFYFKFDFRGGPAYFDSGLKAMLLLASRVSELKKNGQTLSAYLNSFPQLFRSGELNFKVKDPAGVMREVEEIYKKRRGKISRTDGITLKFPKEGWWFNLRPSNTESFLRLNMESSDPKRLKEELQKLNMCVNELDKS